MTLRNVLTVAGLAMLLTVPAGAAEQKRVLSDAELQQVNAGVYLYAELFRRQFFFSLGDRLFGNQANSNSCPACTGNGVEIGNADRSLLVIPLPSLRLRANSK